MSRDLEPVQLGLPLANFCVPAIISGDHLSMSTRKKKTREMRTLCASGGTINQESEAAKNTHAFGSAVSPAGDTLRVLYPLEDSAQTGMADQLKITGLFGGRDALEIVEEKRAERSRIEYSGSPITVERLLGIHDLLISYRISHQA